MRIFASWSGSSSRAIAEIFKEWLPSVLQDLEVYVSSQDIAKGSRWLNEVNSNLQDHDFGISIVTPENAVAPWLLYEAGAIAKSLNGRLVPILCGMEAIDVVNHPLLQFQYIKAPDETELYHLIEDLNKVREKKLPDERLRLTFDKWYPDFIEKYEAVTLDKAPPVKGEAALRTALLPVLEMIMREMRDIRSEMSELKGAEASRLRQLRIADALMHPNQGNLGLFALGRSKAIPDGQDTDTPLAAFSQVPESGLLG